MSEESLASVRMAEESSEHLETGGAIGGFAGPEHETLSNPDVTFMNNSRSGCMSWLTRVYREIESLMSDPNSVDEVLVKRELIDAAFSRFEEVHTSLLACLEDGEDKKSLEESFAVQLERKRNFLAKVDAWVDEVYTQVFRTAPSVEPEDSRSQSGLASSKSSKSRASSSKGWISSRVRLREAKERRELAQLKLQQLKLTQDLEQRKTVLKNQEEQLRLMHEYELATVSERIWMAPETIVDSNPVDRVDTRYRRENIFESSHSVDFKSESIPRTTDVPIPSVQDPVVRQSVPDLTPPSKSGLNPLAPEWKYKTPASPVTNTNTTNENAANPSKQNVEQLVQSLTSDLNVGFNLPRTEILTFDGNPLEYWKFIHNFEANIIGLTDNPRKKLTYLIQYCTGEAREVI